MIIGLDVGFGHVKSIAAEARHEFPAVVAPWEAEGYRIHGLPAGPWPAGLQYDEHSYLVGAPALRRSSRRFSSLDREWVGSDVWRVLTLMALQRIVPTSGMDVRVVTGLPVGDLGRYAAQVRAWLVGHHKIELLPSGEPWEVTIVEAHVMPQPFGTLLALVLDDLGDLQDRTLARGRVGIIDIGFRTTDYLTVDALETVPGRSLSRNTGMTEVLLAVSQLVQTIGGLELDPHDLDEAMLARTLTLSGRECHLDGIAGPILEDHARAIASHATMLWGHGQALHAILVTGGGADLLGHHLASLGPHVRVVPDARLQNAMGYARYGRRLGRSRQRAA